MDDDRIERRRNTDELATVRRLIPSPGPKSVGFLVWWVLGLYALFLAGAPYTPTVQEEQRYADLMTQAVFSEELRQAQHALMVEQRQLDEVNVWFWWTRSPYDRLVPEARRRVAEARAIFDAESRQRDELVSEAKSTVGIWSAYGVEEVRERFWKAYQSGKDFAKRMTWWDVLLGGVSRRDEEAWVSIMRWVGQIMMNFTVGLISALVSFFFSLLSMLWEYKASYASGIAFFVVAMSGASAMVALFIGGMYGTAVGGVYILAKNAQQARLEGRCALPAPRRTRARLLTRRCAAAPQGPSAASLCARPRALPVTMHGARECGHVGGLAQWPGSRRPCGAVCAPRAARRCAPAWVTLERQTSAKV